MLTSKKHLNGRSLAIALLFLVLLAGAPLTRLNNVGASQLGAEYINFNIASSSEYTCQDDDFATSLRKNYYENAYKTEVDALKINSTCQFNIFSKFVNEVDGENPHNFINRFVRLTHDVDTNSTVDGLEVSDSNETLNAAGNVSVDNAFVVVGESEDNNFAGHFNGNNHLISNAVYLNNDAQTGGLEKNLGVFGHLQGTVENLRLDNIKVLGFASGNDGVDDSRRGATSMPGYNQRRCFDWIQYGHSFQCAHYQFNCFGVNIRFKCCKVDLLE